MAEERLDDQLEPRYNSPVPVQDIVLKTFLEGWTIKMGGERVREIRADSARWWWLLGIYLQKNLQQLSCKTYIKYKNKSRQKILYDDVISAVDYFLTNGMHTLQNQWKNRIVDRDKKKNTHFITYYESILVNH